LRRIESNDVRKVLAPNNSGFFLDASARVAAHYRAGLVRLLRYCARPLDVDCRRS
jgi:hypothetical protein